MSGTIEPYKLATISWDAVNTIERPLLYAGMTLGYLVIVSYEYSWFVSLFTGHVTMRDMAAIFGLGIAEMSLSYCLDRPVRWWAVSASLCCVGIFGFWNSRQKAKLIKYCPREIEDLLARKLRLNFWLATVLTVVSAATAMTLFVDRRLRFEWTAGVAQVSTRS